MTGGEPELSVSSGRVRAVFRKEILEYRRNRFILATMALVPFGYLIFPLIMVFAIPAASASVLHRYQPLLYLVGVAAIAPASVSSYSVVGERRQGTLEPLLTSPIRREDLVAGKFLAAFAPSVAICYLVYGIYLAVVAVFAPGVVAHAVMWAPALVPALVFIPLVAACSVWIGIAVSARCADPRAAQQLATFASLVLVLLAALVAFDVIHATLGLGVILAAVLVAADGLGWRLASAILDRERLIAGVG